MLPKRSTADHYRIMPTAATIATFLLPGAVGADGPSVAVLPTSRRDRLARKGLYDTKIKEKEKGFAGEARTLNGCARSFILQVVVCGWIFWSFSFSVLLRGRGVRWVRVREDMLRLFGIGQQYEGFFRDVTAIFVSFGKSTEVLFVRGGGG